ncbi:hypothetical protein MMC21_002614 [Puttea exsequens]|nr:hypothetical protein [Puttea exsequens]
MVKIATFSVVLLVPIALALPNPLNFLKSRQYAQFPDLGAVANNVPNFGDPLFDWDDDMFQGVDFGDKVRRALKSLNPF